MLGSSFPSPIPHGPGSLSAGAIVELVVAGMFVVLGVRSLVRWMGRRFEADSSGERALYSLHVTARVGMWFAFAGFFVGYALVDDPQGFRWYVMIPLSLAAIQFLTALALGLRGPGRPNAEDGQPG